MASLMVQLPETRTEVQNLALDESFVYVHLEIHTSQTPLMVRIWPTTFLIDRVSGHRSTLVHAENITYAPDWTPVPPHTRFSFLLIFTGLPSACSHFDLVEVAGSGEGGAFRVSNILRNEKDVYWLALGV